MKNINIIHNNIEAIVKKVNKKNSKKKINIISKENENNKKNNNLFNINEFLHKKVGKTSRMNKTKKILLLKPPATYKTISQEILNMNNAENSTNCLTLKKIRNPMLDDFFKKVHYSNNNTYSKINLKRKGYYKTLEEREKEKEKEKEKEEIMRIIKDRIKNKTNLFQIYDSNTKSNYSNNNNDFTRISNDKRKKLSLNISQLKSFNKEKYYITNKYLKHSNI